MHYLCTSLHGLHGGIRGKAHLCLPQMHLPSSIPLGTRKSLGRGMQENEPTAYLRLYYVSVPTQEKVLRNATDSTSVQGRYLNIAHPKRSPTDNPRLRRLQHHPILCLLKVQPRCPRKVIFLHRL